MSLSTESIFGRQLLNRITVADYVDWAVGMVVRGKDSTNLRMLAGLDTTVSLSEAEHHFVRALHELEVSEPNRTSKLRAYLAEIAKQVLDGTISPRDGANLLSEICEFLDSSE